LFQSRSVLEGKGAAQMRGRSRCRSFAAALVLFALLAVALVVTAGYGGASDKPKTSSAPSGTREKVFTVQELAGFDGKNGKPAYVAVDGVVYDVTGSANWPGGKHSPCSLDSAAGKDLSEVIKQAPPRMRTYIQAKPVVGSLQGN